MTVERHTNHRVEVVSKHECKVHLPDGHVLNPGPGPRTRTFFITSDVDYVREKYWDGREVVLDWEEVIVCLDVEPLDVWVDRLIRNRVNDHLDRNTFPMSRGVSLVS